MKPLLHPFFTNLTQIYEKKSDILFPITVPKHIEISLLKVKSCSVMYVFLVRLNPD